MKIKGKTLGSNSVKGWWVSKGMPSLPSFVELCYEEIWDRALPEELRWLKERGVVLVLIHDHVVLKSTLPW